MRDPALKRSALDVWSTDPWRPGARPAPRTPHGADRWSVPSARTIAVADGAEPEVASLARSTAEMLCWITALAVVVYCLAAAMLATAASSPPPVGDGAVDVRSPALMRPTANPFERSALSTFYGRQPGDLDERVVIDHLAAAPAPAIPAETVVPAPAVRDPAALVAAGSGKPFRDSTAGGEPCPYCPELVVVPAGAFRMGSNAAEAFRLDWQTEREQPLVDVSIGQPFAVARFAVTFDEWDACVVAGACLAKPADFGWGRGTRPVMNLTWDEASTYIAWLSARTGKPYRLLSEAEREYVTRAGTSTPFWFGAAPAPRQANYLAEGASGASAKEQTVPVDSFAPNPWGLYNVHGNVWDWTADCWNETHKGHPGDGAPLQTGDCAQRVLKGGSWLHPPMLMRAAARTRVAKEFRANSIGLRVARTIADDNPVTVPAAR